MYQEASNTNLLMLLYTAVYPFLAALIVSFVAGKLLRASSYLGYLSGFILGLSLIHSGLSFPPHQAIDYYIITTLISIVSLLCFTQIKALTIRNGISFLLFGLSFYLLLNPVLKHSGLVVSLSWAVVCALVALCYLLVAEKAQGNKPYNTHNNSANLANCLFPIGLMIVAGSAAPVVSIGGSLLIGQLLGALGAAIFGYVVIIYVTKTASSWASIPALLMLGGLIAQSHVLADIPLSVILMLAISGFITPIALFFNNKTHNIIISQIIISSFISGLSLWLVWPESSLY
jgi:hypothetical protein